MQKLKQFVTPDSLSPETFSVIQLRTIDEPLLPNLRTLELTGIEWWLMPFIDLFLSPRTTSVTLGFKSNLPDAVIASAITTLPTLCPGLQAITLYTLPRSLMITAAISGMLLATNQNALQKFRADSPLTEEASEVTYKLPNLCDLWVVIERGAPLPSALLPNLTDLKITCDNEDDWPQLFHRATFGKLESVAFHPRSEQIGDFLGAFERAALSSSIPNTLSKFSILSWHSWNPKYSSLLPFTQLVDLEIDLSCNGGCSSMVDDNIIISLSREMPKLESLALGGAPCRQITVGVTTKGLLALAHHCPKLANLCVHLQVASLGELPGIPGIVPRAEVTALWMDCALARLVVGATPVPEGSAMIIALTLLRIFPRLHRIVSPEGLWEEVEDAINCSRKIIDYSSEQCLFSTTP